MDPTIDRDTDSLRLFVQSLNSFSSDLILLNSHLKNCCYQASGLMQDNSGQQALDILIVQTEEFDIINQRVNMLAEAIMKSAVFIEQSNYLL